jgi:SAM-dependent methyltransferase
MPDPVLPSPSKSAFPRWKLPHLVKGTLTWIPILDAWRKRHASAAGPESPTYCYAVWLRHLVLLHACGFQINVARVGELGPGNSLGTGLASLLTGARYYVGLDVLPFSTKANLARIFADLVQKFSRKEPIPDDVDLPQVRPKLDSYQFPNHLIRWSDFSDRVEQIRGNLTMGINRGQLLHYHAPWTSLNGVATSSLDLVYSQSVLEHVDAVEGTYRTMFAWLKPGGYASHNIDFSAHYLSPFWNGHWAYSDREWWLVRGRREFLLNREPLSAHLEYAEKAGFEILLAKRDTATDGLTPEMLSPRFRALGPVDARTRSAFLVLRKPKAVK